MIEFKNLTKQYDNGATALSDINLFIDKGEFVFLMGHSGAGKSTMIKTLIKEVEPSSGEIFINFKNVTKLKRSKIPEYRRSIGIVFQDFKLLLNKTVYENVALTLRIIEEPNKAIRKKVQNIIHTVGLEGKLDRFPNELSGGEQQRVAIARALVNNPSLLICDEPTGNLDAKTAWEIMEILEKVNSLGTTIIMATHAKNIVEKMNKRVIVLDKGKVVKDQKARRDKTYEN